MNDASTFLMVLRFGFSLAFVLGMIWFAARVVKKQGNLRLGANNKQKIEVVDRQPITRHASVAVVSLSGRAVLLGVTDQSVTLLGDAPEFDTEATIDQPVEVDLESLDLEDLDLSGSISDGKEPSRRRIGVMESESSTPSRMSFLDALRERSVRR